LFGGLQAQDRAPDPFAAFRTQTDEWIAEAMTRDRVPGMSLLVALGETIVMAKGYGVADVENDVPVTSKSVFQIGSLTKQFTAAAIMKMVDAGELRLDDQLNDLLPEFAFPGKEVTVHQLLNHTSGITSYTRFRATLAKLEYRRIRHRDMYEVIKDQHFEFEPGTGYKYNNSGYYLLGVIIEKVSGRKYSDYLAEHLWKGSGLTETYFQRTPRIIKHRARGYTQSFLLGELQNARVAGQWPFAAGGLLSTTRDLHRWNLALHGGSLISKDSYAKMTTPTSRGSPTRPHTYGYGLNIHDRDGRRVFVHSGGIPGFKCFNAFFPKSQLTVVLLCNKFETGPGALVIKISEAALAVQR